MGIFLITCQLSRGKIWR